MKQDEKRNQQDPGELIRSAGRRPAIPEDDFASIKEATGTAWRQMVAAERSRSSRRRTIYAIAASLIVLLLGGWFWLSGTNPFGSAEIATVQFATGDLTVGDILTEGEDLEPSGLVALRMAGGQSVRIDGGTRLQLLSSSRLQLDLGALYVDSGPSVPAGAVIEVRTPLGIVREIGTQFEIRITGEAESMQVSVREGSVTIEQEAETISAARGEQLTLDREGLIARSTLATDAAHWSWVLDAAPALEIEGRTLGHYLDWVARETGWQIRYADEELERSAETILLHGTIEGMRPDESLGVILEGSGLYYLTEDGAVLIARP
jgi:ferric-dicitrate binding protein FerR (iron transport regulator)